MTTPTPDAPGARMTTPDAPAADAPAPATAPTLPSRAARDLAVAVAELLSSAELTVADVAWLVGAIRPERQRGSGVTPATRLDPGAGRVPPLTFPRVAIAPVMAVGRTPVKTSSRHASYTRPLPPRPILSIH